jgi:hypothetical protein
MPEPTQPPTPGPPAVAAPSAPVTPTPRRRGCGCWLLVLAALVAAAAAAAYVLAQPTFQLTNALKGSVRLEINKKVRLVQPGETVRIGVGRGLLVAEWALQRPLSADGQPMGEAILGSWVVPTPRGTIRRTAGPRLDTGDYFAPLITNETGRSPRLYRLLPTLPEQHSSGNGPGWATCHIPGTRARCASGRLRGRAWLR